MEQLAIILGVFLFGYLINIFYITVLYHRGLTHRSILLKPALERWLAQTGNWVTGLDPKAWACMHRLHHKHSDTPADPHSPVHYGVFGVMRAQLQSYEKILVHLLRGDKEYTDIVADIAIDVSFLNRKKLWILPYLLHTGIALALGLALANIWVGVAYFLGIMSHPIQGWMVNALAHNTGYRNFDSPDHSMNNTLVSILVFGEGLQNNHHASPTSANFSFKPWEFDLGYGLCRLAEKIGMIEIPEQSLKTLASNG